MADPYTTTPAAHGKATLGPVRSYASPLTGATGPASWIGLWGNGSMTVIAGPMLASPKTAAAAVARRLGAVNGPVAVIVSAVLVRFRRRNGPIWSVVLPGSVAGRPKSTLRFTELAAAMADAAAGQPLLLWLDVSALTCIGRRESGWLNAATAAFVAAWPETAGPTPTVLTSACATGDSLATAGEFLARGDANAPDREPDALGTRLAALLTAHGVEASVTLPEHIRTELEATDHGSRLDAAVELAHLSDSGDRAATALLARLASGDPVASVRSYADKLARRREQPRLATLRSAGTIPRTVYCDAARGIFLPTLLPQLGGPVSIGVDPPLGEPADRPRHTVDLAPYLLSRTPITDRQYLTYLAEVDLPCPEHWAEEPDLWRAGSDRPVVMVSYYDAVGYCAWLTGHLRATGALPADQRVALPSEIEWESATGNARGDLHPWGEVPDPTRCNIRATGIGHLSNVGVFSPRGDTETGCADLIGNVWEWTRSIWGPGYRTPARTYPYPPTRDHPDALAAATVRRVVRGGAFYYATDCANAYTRNRMLPHRPHPGGGFRVAVVKENR